MSTAAGLAVEVEDEEEELVAAVALAVRRGAGEGEKKGRHKILNLAAVQRAPFPWGSLDAALPSSEAFS